MSSELLVAFDGLDLVAVWDPEGGLGDEDGQALRRAFGARVDVAACGPGSPPRCWVAGRIHEREQLADTLGAARDTPIESLLLLARTRWSDDLYARLRGQFTLVFWDPERHAVTVVGDQLGVRAPHLHRKGGRLHVATRISLLVAALPRVPEPSHAGVLKALSGEMPAVEATLFEGVERLPGGDLLVAGRPGVHTRPYWRPRYEPAGNVAVEEASELVWTALRQAVRRRLESTPAGGIVMSSGVDSTSVAAAAVAEGWQPPTYSTVFPGRPDVDESERVDLVVDALGVPNVQMQVEPAGAFGLFLDFLRTTGMLVPGAGYLIERPLLLQAADAGTTALLDGQGGDELFSVAGFLIADRVRRGRLRASMDLTRRLPGAGRGSREQLVRAWRFYVEGGAVPLFVLARRRRQSSLRRFLRAGLLTRESAKLLVETDASLDWMRNRTGPLWWANKAWLLTRARESVRIADYVRERGALAGIEAMPPLFDVDLIETALGIPPEAEFDPHIDRPLIRRATAGFVPDEVRLSTFKSNLAPFFLEATLRDHAPMRALLEQPLRLAPYVNVDELRTYFRTPPAATGPAAWEWSSALWRVVTLECWLRHLEDPALVPASDELEPPRWSVYRRREHRPVAAGAPPV